MSKKIIYQISFLASSSMLLSAFYLEYFHGALPCDLCITQRWFHALIITYSLISLFILENFFRARTIWLLGLSTTWLASAIAGLYHFGIEMNFWTGPDDCSSNIDFSKDLLTYLLNKSPIKCDEIMFEIFGLSLAGWNALLSFLIFLAISYFMIFKRSLKL